MRIVCGFHLNRVLSILVSLFIGAGISLSTAEAQQRELPVVIQERVNISGQSPVRIIGGDYSSGFIMREDRVIDSDQKRAYALIAPGSRRFSGRRFIFQNGAVQIQPDARLGNRDQDSQTVGSAGLLIVLPTGDGDTDRAVSLWAEIMATTLKGRYYIAIVTPPHWDGPSPTLWLTEANVKQVRGARFSTEELVADIVHDVSLRYNIDAKRTFLFGAAESGIATYACSLAEKTPFNGFYIHDAPFRAAQLPSLNHRSPTYLRGRRLFIQQSLEDKTGPLWMGEVARKVLTEHGARVKLTSSHTSAPYKFPENSWSPIADVIAWLEHDAGK